MGGKGGPFQKDGPAVQKPNQLRRSQVATGPVLS